MKKPFVTKEQVEEIVKTYPTPFYLYDEKQIRENVRKVLKAFAWNKGFKEYYLDTILRDTAAVTGLEGIRRIVGIAHVKDITSIQHVKPEMGILTHCNAGTIATAKYGTALAPLYLGAEKGYNFKVFADETRPLLQGARLTAWELNEAGIDVTLICDNMASIVMKNGWIDAVVVGCDRVAYNGDTANKIGTSGVAILAKEYGISGMKSQWLQKVSKPIIQLLM